MNTTAPLTDGISSDAVYEHSPVTRRKVTDLFSREEIQRLTARSDAWGAWGIASTWALVGAGFALCGWALTLPVAAMIPVGMLGLALLGGRQLALAILTHEASHKTLFASGWANDVLADWLCARPLGLDLAKYRVHHLIHHTKTGTPEDTDISLVAGLPCSRVSLLRKFARDLSGLTGLKFLLGRVLMDAGYLKWTVASQVEKLPQDGRTAWDVVKTFAGNTWKAVVMNALLFGALAAAGHGELYLAWVLAYLIPYPLFIRIRAMAEHAGTEKSADMFRNTRTTRAGLIARTFVAPCHVNFHIEHHAMASVPYYRLPEAHALLRARGMVDEPPGYLAVLDRLSSVQA
ncbi:fatty acid desaturase [Fluviicoccus keumensis]|uniref:Fatty acid desaturase n=1 Tax=Fluviicoccus keumensis TaxID=1435465 RepID=A0A4Q7ZB82_9GAMM|nr:fatty acid desaturase family protein [Fluviicoccus keumensis]RZU47862.1 fatty acid desaturase [Fluviicoccus keumensis]